MSGHDATLVDIAEDLDVSGKVSPFDRDGLGPWLTEEKARLWDVLVAWKLDRASRSAVDTLNLIRWCEEHGKRIVCVDDGIDTGTKMGKLFAQIAAVFAEVERTTIMERTQDSRQELRALGRWAGGTPPYGHRAAPDGTGGWRLELDPELAERVRMMADWVINGGSYQGLAHKLNDDGVSAPRSDNSLGWRGSVIPRLLSNETVLWGKAVHNGQALDHVNHTEPLMDAVTTMKLIAATRDLVRALRRRPGAGRIALADAVPTGCGS